MDEKTPVAEHVLHEHLVLVANLPAHLDAHGDWFVNGGLNAYDGRPTWGYAEHAEVAGDGSGLIVVTMTDPMQVAAFRTLNPITEAPLSLTLSKSFRAPATCPVCETPDHQEESETS